MRDGMRIFIGHRGELFGRREVVRIDAFHSEEEAFEFFTEIVMTENIQIDTKKVWLGHYKKCDLIGYVVKSSGGNGYFIFDSKFPNL